MNEYEPKVLADRYMAFFAVRCHYLPQDVYRMPWGSAIQLSLVADQLHDEQVAQRNEAAIRQARLNGAF